MYDWPSVTSNLIPNEIHWKKLKEEFNMYQLTPYERLHARLAEGKPDTYAILPDPNAKNTGQLILVSQRRQYPLVEFALRLTHCGKSQFWTEKNFTHEFIIRIPKNGTTVFALQQHSGEPLITSESNDYNMKIIAFVDIHDRDRVPFSLCAHCSNAGCTPTRASGAALLYPQVVSLWHDDMVEMAAVQNTTEAAVRMREDAQLDDNGQNRHW